MFAADDVVNLVGEPRVLFVDKTVFASVDRATSHFGAERIADVSGHARGFGAPSPWPFSGCVPAPRSGPTQPCPRTTGHSLFPARSTPQLSAALLTRAERE